MKRPEYVTCVRSGMADETQTVLCGRDVGFDFAFVDPAHAFLNARQNGRLQTCPECAAFIIGVFTAEQATTPQEPRDG